MKPGDLVELRIGQLSAEICDEELPWIVGSVKYPNRYRNQVGIILYEGPYKVFVVLLQSGRTETFQKSSLQVVS